MQTEIAATANYTAMLMGLAMNCPVGHDNPVECPLHRVRHLSLVQRFEWAKSQTRQEAENILSYHIFCCPQMQKQALYIPAGGKSQGVPAPKFGGRATR